MVDFTLEVSQSLPTANSDKPLLPTLLLPKQNRADGGSQQNLASDHHGQPVLHFFVFKQHPNRTDLATNLDWLWAFRFRVRDGVRGREDVFSSGANGHFYFYFNCLTHLRIGDRGCFIVVSRVCNIVRCGVVPHGVVEYCFLKASVNRIRWPWPWPWAFSLHCSLTFTVCSFCILFIYVPFRRLRLVYKPVRVLFVILSIWAILPPDQLIKVLQVPLLDPSRIIGLECNDEDNRCQMQ